MKKMTFVAFLFSTLAMAGEPVLIKEVRQTANLMPGPGPVHRPIQTSLEVEVLSGGCTRPEDFKVLVVRTDKEQTLEIVRTRPDFCEMVPHRKAVTLETQKLGLSSTSPIRILNPLYADEQVAH